MRIWNNIVHKNEAAKQFSFLFIYAYNICVQLKWISTHKISTFFQSFALYFTSGSLDFFNEKKNVEWIKLSFKFHCIFDDVGKKRKWAQYNRENGEKKPGTTLNKRLWNMQLAFVLKCVFEHLQLIRNAAVNRTDSFVHNTNCFGY